MLIVETRTGLKLAVRGPIGSDDPYVFRSALGAIRRGAQYRMMPAKVFYDTVGERFRALWRDGGRLRLVACLDDDRSFIVGFVVGDPSVPLVDMVKVRQSFTGQGAATAMLSIMGITPDAPARITFATPDYERRRSWPLLEAVR